MAYLLHDLARLLPPTGRLSQSARALGFLQGDEETLSLLLLDSPARMRGTNSKAVQYILLLSPLRLASDLVAKKCVSCAVAFEDGEWGGACGKDLAVGLALALAYFSAIFELMELMELK